MPDTNETQLEKTFSDLAYSHLRDKAQALLDYLVGFQMLKQEDDGQRAVGIFGFEVDKDFYYSPVFFLNGEIRGLDSLYSVKSDLFMPLTDDWVNTIINRRQQELGEANTQSRTERGIHVPNYTRLSVIPGGAGAINLKLSQAGVQAAMGGRNEKLAAAAANFSLTDELRETGLGPVFHQVLERYPKVADAFEAHGYSVLDLMPEARLPKRAADDAAVVVINTVTDERVTDLTDEQREEILAGGAVVMDRRPEVERSFVYPTETHRVLENPTEGGLYDLLWADGTTTLCLVCPSNDLKNTALVFCTETKQHCTIDRRCVWIVRRYSRQELIQWLQDNGSDPSSVRQGQVVAFVSDKGEATPGFCIGGRMVGADGLTVLAIRDRYRMGAGSGQSGRVDVCCGDPGGSKWNTHYRGDNGDGPHNAFLDLTIGGNGDNEFTGKSNRPCDPNDRVEQIIVRETGAAAPAYTKKQLIVNDRRFWAVELNTFTLSSEKGRDWQDETYGSPNWDAVLTYQDFGDPNTVCAVIEKSATAMKIWRRDNEFTVKVGESVDSARTVGHALRILMLKHGLDEASAREIYDSASHVVGTRWFRPGSKTAAELLRLPEAQDESLGGFLSSYHRTQIPWDNINQAQPELDNREFYRYFSPFGGGGGGDDGDIGAPDTMQVVQQAAQTGQKDVFDAAALGSLIKSHNPTDLVDRFLPTIISGMDRIGRMLFLIYWHYEDFEDRWGEDDMSEFVDNLKSVFEQLGDVVVFAKKRTLAGDPEHYGMGMIPAMEDAG